MKKEFIVLSVIITIISVSFFTACGEEEQPKNQSATITNLFGAGFTATVKGYLTDTEWTGVVDKIEDALNGAYTGGGLTQKGRFGAAYENNDVKIVIEKNSLGYSKWKTSEDGKTMYLAFGALNNDLQGSVTAAADKMGVPEAGFAQVKDQTILPSIFLS